MATVARYLLTRETPTVGDTVSLAIVLLVATAVLAVVLWVPTRLAAAGKLDYRGIVGIRTAATRSSLEAWQRGHEAAMIYTRMCPWAAGTVIVLGIVGWIFAGPAAAVAAGFVGLACMAFLGIFAVIFAQIAAGHVARQRPSG